MKTQVYKTIILSMLFSCIASANTNKPAINLAPEQWSSIKQQMNISPVLHQQSYVKASNTEVDDSFGYSVSISGDTMVVGAIGEDSNLISDENNNDSSLSGAAYVFVRVQGIWAKQAYLKSSNIDATDFFGSSVAISGDTIVVGAVGDASNATIINGDQSDNSASFSGAAYVFVRNGASWSQEAYLKASNSEAGDQFGRFVDIDGETIIVGAWWEDGDGINGENNNDEVDSGAAYIFQRDEGSWTQEAYLKASDASSDDGMGFAVGISGNTVVVGADGKDGLIDNVQTSDLGAAYVFEFDGLGWGEQAKLVSENPDLSDHFGMDVGIFGETIIVSAPNEDSNSIDGPMDNSIDGSGAVYVFIRDGEAWGNGDYLKASNPGAGDQFGGSIAIDGNKIAISTIYEQSNSVGINGNQLNDLADQSGAVYIFTNTSGLWSQEAYLKSSNSELEDRFGKDVAISNGSIVAGAHTEDSDSTLINSGESNNSASNSGAVFVFAPRPDAMFSNGFE